MESERMQLYRAAILYRNNIISQLQSGAISEDDYYRIMEDFEDRYYDGLTKINASCFQYITMVSRNEWRVSLNVQGEPFVTCSSFESAVDTLLDAGVIDNPLEWLER